MKLQDLIESFAKTRWQEDIYPKDLDDLVDEIRTWALEMVGEDWEHTEFYPGAPGDLKADGVNTAKDEIRQKIEESTK